MVAMRKHLTLALSLLGLFVSSYLWWVYNSPSHPMVCIGGGCDVVRASSYAHVWGVSTPVFGVIMYLALAFLAFAETLAGDWVAAAVRHMMVIISSGGFLISLGLTGVEAFVIHAWCAWCLTSALTVTLIMILALRGVLRPARPFEPMAALAAARGQLGIVVAAIVVGVPAFMTLANSGEFAPPQQAPQHVLATQLVRPDSHATGDLQSPVTVVEFGDFECPMCGLAEKSFSQLMQRYSGQVRFVFRQFPLAKPHPQAEKAAEASECAAAQGKFWEARSYYYAHQQDLSVKALESYASPLGLNQAQFNQCLESGAMAGRVQQDRDDGRALGVRATPTFFFGSQMFEGLPSLAQSSEVLNQLLAASSTGLPPQTAGVPAAQAAGQAGAATTPGSPASEQTQQAGGHSAGTAPRQDTAPAPPAPKAAASQPTSGGDAAKSASASGGLGNSVSGGVFGSAGTNAIASMQSGSALTCNPNDAQLQQPGTVHTDEVKSLFNATPKPVFVDIRAANDFAGGHIPGAVNIPLEEMPSRWNTLPEDRTIIIYQGGRRTGSAEDACAFSRAAGRVLLAHGFNPDRVKVFQEGLMAWEKAGMPVGR